MQWRGVMLPLNSTASKVWNPQSFVFSKIFYIMNLRQSQFGLLDPKGNAGFYHIDTQ